MAGQNLFMLLFMVIETAAICGRCRGIHSADRVPFPLQGSRKEINGVNIQDRVIT